MNSKQQPLVSKYSRIHPIKLPHRVWPNKTLEKAPTWCSVDLRDGNQALVNPMNLQQKIDFFNYLVSIGFKHIEVGFPSASSVEYNFVRHIIENNLIPNDVSIQVLTQSREHLIEKTMAAVEGAPSAIIHLYNSTSIAQRKYVFQKSKEDIVKIALDGIALIKKNLTNNHKNILLEYSPESFTGTEIDFSVDICNQVINAWDVSSPIIINLPATVEMFMPNVYADMIEYASTHLNNRENVILSVHTHNDRGTCTAATELALLAGADRVEGTLFGNGERTGNLDITTVALNLYMHGIDPQLDVYNLDKMEDVYKACTGMTIPERHPYAGELVFTAFSGSHQDAIKKGMAQYDKQTSWDVPYLTIDPEDIGKKYQAIIRINSQSGKGGVAYILENEFQCIIPKRMQATVSQFIQKSTESSGTEISSNDIWEIFSKEFINRDEHLQLTKLKTELNDDGVVSCELNINHDGNELNFKSVGNGPIDASKKALSTLFPSITIESYSEHSLSEGSDSKAICYLTVLFGEDVFHGVGIDTNITLASVKALISAINRKIKGSN
ncbi:MAG: 2-isopropylmalate synthase [Candidatus Margulisiibacteriota bacterium]|nr:2-isopropylmalate synthase [Candidatus Margulisiibacteriota bacterium]